MVKLNYNVISLSKLKLQLYFFYFSAIALLCDGLFSYFLRGPLTYWRQLVVVVGLFLLIAAPKRLFNEKGRHFLLLVSLCVFIVIFRGIVTYIELEFNIIRLGYALILAICGIPFFLFPALIVCGHKDPLDFFLFFTILGSFFGIGMIFDGLYGGYFLFLKENTLAIGVTIDDIYRYSFLSQIITTFGVFDAFCLMSSLYLMYKAKQLPIQLIYLSSSLLIVAGSWFTGSRQILLPLCFMEFIGIFGYWIYGKGNKILFSVLGGIFMFILSFWGYQFLVNKSSQAMNSRYSVENVQYDLRYLDWKQGVDDILNDPFVMVFGKGLAYATGQKSQPHEEVGSHYENSFLARISETGISGLLLLLLPCVFILRQVVLAQKMEYLDWLSLLVVSVYLFSSSCSPNGLGFTSQMAIYTLAGVYVFRDYFVQCNG